MVQCASKSTLNFSGQNCPYNILEKKLSHLVSFVIMIYSGDFFQLEILSTSIYKRIRRNLLCQDRHDTHDGRPSVDWLHSSLSWPPAKAVAAVLTAPSLYPLLRNLLAKRKM